MRIALSESDLKNNTLIPPTGSGGNKTLSGQNAQKWLSLLAI